MHNTSNLLSAKTLRLQLIHDSFTGIFLAHFKQNTSNWVYDSPEYCCQTCLYLYDPSLDASNRIIDNIMKRESCQTGFLNMTVHCPQTASTLTGSQSNRAPLQCGGTGDSRHGCAVDKSTVAVPLTC